MNYPATELRGILSIKCMIKDCVIAIYFSVNQQAICDYIMKLAIEMAKTNLVISLLVYADPHPLFKGLLFSKRQPVLYRDKGVYLCRPIYLIPFQRFTVVKQWNRWLFLHLAYPIVIVYLRYKQNKSLVGYKQFFLFYHPHKEKKYFQTMYRYFSRRSTTVFDIVDYPDVQNDQERLYFEDFVRRVDVTVVNSHSLYKRFLRIRQDIAVVPLGFSLAEFAHPLPVKAFSRDKPLIGFVGSIGSKLDFPLLYDLIERNPRYNFVFWGPIEYVQGEVAQILKRKIISLFSYSNVITGQSKNKRVIPNIIAQFDACVIPYDTRRADVRLSYPMKLFEYFYLGKPVISTPIEALKRFPKYVKIGSTVEEWERHIKVLLSRPWPKNYKEAQRLLATENSWEKKIKAIIRAM